MRTITFKEFADIIESAYAVEIDDSLSYPYVNEYTDDNDKQVYDYIDIHYSTDYNVVENTFYPNECNIMVTDDGRLVVCANDDTYFIKVLDFKPIK